MGKLTLGIHLDVGAYGQEVINAIVRLPNNFILMDCQMSEMKDFKATKEIFRREPLSKDREMFGKVPPMSRQIPFIAMTANTMNGDREKSLEEGMDDFIAKPISVDKLEEILSE